MAIRRVLVKVRVLLKNGSNDIIITGLLMKQQLSMVTTDVITMTITNVATFTNGYNKCNHNSNY